MLSIQGVYHLSVVSSKCYQFTETEKESNLIYENSIKINVTKSIHIFPSKVRTDRSSNFILFTTKAFLVVGLATKNVGVHYEVRFKSVLKI